MVNKICFAKRENPVTETVRRRGINASRFLSKGFSSDGYSIKISHFLASTRNRKTKKKGSAFRAKFSVLPLERRQVNSISIKGHIEHSNERQKWGKKHIKRWRRHSRHRYQEKKQLSRQPSVLDNWFQPVLYCIMFVIIAWKRVIFIVTIPSFPVTIGWSHNQSPGNRSQQNTWRIHLTNNSLILQHKQRDCWWWRSANVSICTYKTYASTVFLLNLRFALFEMQVVLFITHSLLSDITHIVCGSFAYVFKTLTINKDQLSFEPLKHCLFQSRLDKDLKTFEGRAGE